MRGSRHVASWSLAVPGAWAGALLGAALAALEARGDVGPIVFVERTLNPAARAHGGPSAGPQGSGGKLVLRRADGRLVDLVYNHVRSPSEPLDVADPAASWDGRRIVFSGWASEDGAWRIWEVGADGSELRRVTAGGAERGLGRYGPAAPFLQGFDDHDPCYLPDGRIVFSSTRHPQLAPDGRSRATNLYVVNADGSDLHRITTERFGADTPTVEPATGRIVYSRWWRSLAMGAPPASEGLPAVPVPEPPSVPPGGHYHAPPPAPPPPPTPPLTPPAAPPAAPPAVSAIPDGEFTGLNSWFLAGINPDGTGLSMYSGFHLDRERTQAWRPSFLPSGEVLALFVPEAPFFTLPGPKGLRRLEEGLHAPVALGGPQTFSGRMANEWVYASAEPLPDGRLLVTAARADAPDEFDIYVQRNWLSAPELLHGYHGRGELDAVPLAARSVPPVIAEVTAERLHEEPVFSVAEASARGGSFTFLVENIHGNGAVDVPMPNAPPIGHGLLIEFYMGPQRTGARQPDPPILIRRLPIPRSGRVVMELPAGVPLFEVLRTEEGGVAVGRDGQVYHVGGLNFGSAGQTARCVGCHAGHSTMEVPEDPAWTNLAPSAEVTVSSFEQGGEPGAFRPENLVDRSTRAMTDEWSARRGEGASSITLEWQEALRGREAVLYAARGVAGARPLESVEVALFAGSAVVVRRTIPGPLSREGTRMALEGVAFDRLSVAIPAAAAASGPAALAEIEVIARAAISSASFTRGDADCSRSLDLTDGLAVLEGLFAGDGFCCRAAADSDGNERVELSDAVWALNHLFLEGLPPAAPFPDCGPAETELGCAEEAC